MSEERASQELSTQFHLNQYEALRKEIESCVGEMRAIERYALIGTGVVWAWLATNQQAQAPYIIWWVPLLFILLGYVRTFALIRSVRRLARYIREVERAFFGDKLVGWETYITQNRKPSIRYSIYIFWAILFLATLIVPLIAPIVIKP